MSHSESALLDSTKTLVRGFDPPNLASTDGGRLWFKEPRSRTGSVMSYRPLNLAKSEIRGQR
jgi:hypothetical protein